MKTFLINIFCFLIINVSFSQTDTINTNRGFSFGAQTGGQIVSAIEQNWVYTDDVIIPIYYIGLYIKKNRHCFDINLSNQSVNFKHLVPFVGYSYKFNKKLTKIDLNVATKLYTYIRKYPSSGDFKYYTYSSMAFCYGISASKKYNRLTVNCGIYNYFTFSGENRQYLNGKRRIKKNL
jgi:hypothetical protein